MAYAYVIDERDYGLAIKDLPYGYARLVSLVSDDDVRTGDLFAVAWDTNVNSSHRQVVSLKNPRKTWNQCDWRFVPVAQSIRIDL